MICYEYELIAVPVLGTRAPDFSSLPGSPALKGARVSGATLRKFIDALDRVRVCLPRNATAANSADLVATVLRQRLKREAIKDVLVNDSRPTGDKNVWLTLGGHIYVHPVTASSPKSVSIAYGKPGLGLWSHAMVMLLPRPVTCTCPPMEARRV